MKLAITKHILASHSRQFFVARRSVSFEEKRKDIKDVKIVATWQKIEVASMLNICVFLPFVKHIKNSFRTNLQKCADEDSTSEQPLVPPSEWSVYEYDTF